MLPLLAMGASAEKETSGEACRAVEKENCASIHDWRGPQCTRADY